MLNAELENVERKRLSSRARARDLGGWDTRNADLHTVRSRRFVSVRANRRLRTVWSPTSLPPRPPRSLALARDDSRPSLHFPIQHSAFSIQLLTLSRKSSTSLRSSSTSALSA